MMMMMIIIINIIFHGRKNITSSTTCKYRTAATLYIYIYIYPDSNPAGRHGCMSVMKIVCCQVEISAKS
jgi:hypothetical protein